MKKTISCSLLCLIVAAILFNHSVFAKNMRQDPGQMENGSRLLEIHEAFMNNEINK